MSRSRCVCHAAGRVVMLLASFTAHGNGIHWRGAIYAMHDGYGPELVLTCTHRHRSMKSAVLCAESELAWARRIVALAERHTAIAS